MGCRNFFKEWFAYIAKRKMTCTITTTNEVYVNGQKIPNPPCELNNTTIINNKVYVNGYEYKNGTWKKTLAAWWHKYF